MEILDGKKVSNQIKTQLKQKIDDEYVGKKQIPCLACLLVGDNPASKVYVSSKEKACNNIGDWVSKTWDNIWDWTSKTWNNVKTATSTVWNNIKSF